MSTTPVWELTEHAEGGAGGKVLANVAYRWAEAFASGNCIDIGTTAEPGSPSDGDFYIIGTPTATGSNWPGNEGKAALYITDSATSSSAWHYKTVKEGMRVHVDGAASHAAAGTIAIYDGSTWGTITGGATDADAVHDNVAGEIAAVTEKASPVNADLVLIEDSADANNKKRVQLGNLPGGGGSSLPVTDTTSIAEGSVDATKEVRFECDGITTGTVRVITVADQDVDLTPNSGTYPAAAHASRHHSGGADAIKLDDLAAPDDNTDLNASTTAHGLLPKLSNIATEFLNGQGAWATPAGSGLSNVVEDTTPQLGGMLDVNGQSIGDGTRELLTFVEDASAVNHLEIENNATGTGPTLRAVGDDTNVNLILDAKGAGELKLNAPCDIESLSDALDCNGNAITNVPTITVDEGAEPSTPAAGHGVIYANSSDSKLYYKDDSGTATDLTQSGGGGGLSNVVEDTTPQLGGMLDVNGQAIGDGTRELLTFVEDASAVNHVEIENNSTGLGPEIRSAGDDTNVDLHIDTKGTGVIEMDSPTDVNGQLRVASADGFVLANGSATISNSSSADVTIADNLQVNGNISTTGELDDTSVDNNSTVTGATVSAALDYLDKAFGPVPQWATGRYYYATNMTGVNTTTQSAGSGTILFTPIWVPDDYTVITIVAEVTAASSGQNLKLALYDNSNGSPNNLLDGSGNISAATTGKKTHTISEALERGVYWMAMRSSNAGVTYRAAVITEVAPWLGDATSAGSLGAGPTQWTRSGVSFASAWPDPAAANGSSTASMVICGLERS